MAKKKRERERARAKESVQEQKEKERETSKAMEIWTRRRVASARGRDKDNVYEEMDQSDDEFFSSIYMLRRSPSAHRIQEKPMPARKKRGRERVKHKKKEKEWHAINIKDQQYFEQFQC